MTLQIKSMEDLVDHLSGLEQRINELEVENGKLRSLALDNSREDRKEFARYVSEALPETNIISPNFFKRAFAVWGHFFVAHLIMSISIGLCIAFLMFTMFGVTFGTLLQNVKR